MARKKRPKQRAAIGVLGKMITRRSRGRCELCEGRDDNRLYELPPFPEEPDPERVMMTCGRCRRWLEKGGVDPVEAHFLSSAVWSEEPSVRLGGAQPRVFQPIRDELIDVVFRPTLVVLR